MGAQHQVRKQLFAPLAQLPRQMQITQMSCKASSSCMCTAADVALHDNSKLCLQAFQHCMLFKGKFDCRHPLDKGVRWQVLSQQDVSLSTPLE